MVGKGGNSGAVIFRRHRRLRNNNSGRVPGFAATRSSLPEYIAGAVSRPEPAVASSTPSHGSMLRASSSPEPLAIRIARVAPRVITRRHSRDRLSLAVFLPFIVHSANRIHVISIAQGSEAYWRPDLLRGPLEGDTVQSQKLVAEQQARSVTISQRL